MAQTSWRQPPFTLSESDDRFMRALEDDTEEAPWMVMGDLQFWSASGFAHSLRNYARAQGLGWFVASMHPIEYLWPDEAGKLIRKVLAPDTYVAFVEDRPRESFDSEAEGSFPPFVLEVVSPSSQRRDRQDKPKAYDLLGVREYALFTPRAVGESALEGYRRDAAGQFVAWAPDEQGRLWSAVLELYLVVRGRHLQAQTAAGEWLLIPEQADAAWRQAEAARQQAEAARQEAEAARQQAEAEVERLRQELARYQRPDQPVG